MVSSQGVTKLLPTSSEKMFLWINTGIIALFSIEINRPMAPPLIWGICSAKTALLLQLYPQPHHIYLRHNGPLHPRQPPAVPLQDARLG
jgi:hypothetical protein